MVRLNNISVVYFINGHIRTFKSSLLIEVEMIVIWVMNIFLRL